MLTHITKSFYLLTSLYVYTTTLPTVEVTMSVNIYEVSSECAVDDKELKKENKFAFCFIANFIIYYTLMRLD